jgi:SAM-dependent methyltransferase
MALKDLRDRLFRIIYHGKSCYCLYCGKSFRKFMHEGVRKKVFKKYRVAGGGYKPNVKCPQCGSTDRGRLLYLFFSLRTDVFKRKTRILHISPNFNIARLLVAEKNIDYVCGALFPENFREFNAIEANITDLHFSDNEFDVVICNHVLEHVENDGRAMQELHRVLKPSGFAILQVPLALDLAKTLEDPTLTTCEERKEAFGQSDHLRLYGLDYFERLQKAGFRVVRDNPFTNKWSDDLRKHCLDINEDVIVCYKE